LSIPPIRYASRVLDALPASPPSRAPLAQNGVVELEALVFLKAAEKRAGEDRQRLPGDGASYSPAALKSVRGRERRSWVYGADSPEDALAAPPPNNREARCSVRVSSLPPPMAHPRGGEYPCGHLLPNGGADVGEPFSRTMRKMKIPQIAAYSTIPRPPLAQSPKPAAYCGTCARNAHWG